MENVMKRPRTGRKLMKETYHLSFHEEVGNAISHGVMMFLFLFALPIMSVYGYQKQGWVGTIGIAVYGICMIAMFGGSCLYHIMPYDTQWKTVFRKLDHISILLAIAGTYTPICLCIVPGTLSFVILGIEWTLVIAGVLLKSISKYSHSALSMTLYMAMGWLAVLILPAIIRKTGWAFVGLLLAGGLCYTVGAVFYGRKKPYSHFIWHLMIALAALIFLAAILLFL
ncbi:MAG: hemolysin III family protein [Allobaculum sp.]